MADALGTPGPPAGPGVVSALDHRLDQAGLIAPQGAGMAVRTGVLAGPGTTALVTGTPATGTMTYAIAAHHWVSTRGTADGVYLGATEAAQTVPTTAAPGANSRIDVIWEKQQDQYSTITPDATSAPQYGVTQGTAAASPTKPPIPVGALELATAVVAVGATSTNGANVTITNTAAQTVARGVPIPVNSKVERDALDVYPSLAVVRLDLAGFPIERWITGTTWKRLGLDPVSAERTSGVSGLPINAASTGGPAGAGLTLPALPVGHIVVVELSTDFYVEGVNAPQNLAADIVPTGATRLFGQAGRALSMSSLRVSAHSRQQFRIDVTSAVTFGSSYTVGAGSPRAILQREDWTAWL